MPNSAKMIRKFKLNIDYIFHLERFSVLPFYNYSWRMIKENEQLSVPRIAIGFDMPAGWMFGQQGAPARIAPAAKDDVNAAR